MQTTIPGEELQSLGAQLQTLLAEIPLGIRCALKEGQLIVLGQHRADAVLDAKQTLQSLERKIQSLQLKFAQQVRLYLRIAGQKQPYAYYGFIIQPPPPPPNPVLFRKNLDGGIKERAIAVEQIDQLVQQLGNPAHQANPIPPSYSRTQTAALKRVDPPLSSKSRLGTQPAAVPDQPAISLPKGSDPEVAGMHHQVAFQTGLVVLGLVGGGYALTRPCSVGACPEISTARATIYESAQAMQTASRKEELETAQDYLGQAVALLEKIPFWSSQSQAAENLIKICQNQGIALDQVIEIDNQVSDAIAQAQEPQSIAVWQQMQSLLQSGIAQLETIPFGSDLYSFAQQRLPEYYAQLANVEQQLWMEQQAQYLLSNARRTAQTAITQQKTAQSPADWQQVQTMWKVAIAQLQQTPPGTLAASQAQQLLTAYQTQVPGQ
jgi:hypothetical protein